MSGSGPGWAEVEIRRAELADAAVLAALGAQTFADTYSSEIPPANLDEYLQRSFGPDVQAAELAEPSSTFLIAESGTTVVGYARLRSGNVPPEVGDPDAAELQRIYVLRAWWGSKVGAALLRASLDEVAAQGRHTIWLGVWERNQRALDFYRRWGFEEVGRHAFPLGDEIQTDLVMCRRVDV